MRSFFYGLAAAAAITLAGPGIAIAQDWPTKPVTIIVPFAPGGSADFMARIVAENLSKKLGQQFVVENKAGAGGLLGAGELKKAAPDGYTFGMSSIASHIIAPVRDPNQGFDPVADFSHVAYVGGPPIVIVVHPSLGVKTLAEFIDKAKATTPPLGYVSSGVGTHGNLMAEYFAQQTGIKLNHIPYSGSAPAEADLRGGHVPVGSMTWSSAAEPIRSGELTPIAVASNERIPGFDVPTFKELGYDKLVAATWFGISGPAGVSKEIVDKLNAAVLEVLDQEDVKARFAQDSILIVRYNADEFSAFVKAEAERWQPLAKEVFANAPK